MRKSHGIIRHYKIACDFIPDIREALDIAGCDGMCLETMRPGVTRWEVMDRTEKGCGSLWQFQEQLATMGYKWELEEMIMRTV